MGAKEKRSICVPWSTGGKGIMNLIEALKECLWELNGGKGSTDSKGQATKISDVQSLNIGGGFPKRPFRLKSCAIVVVTENKVLDWGKVEVELKQILSLHGNFSLLALSETEALVEFANNKDRDELLDAEEIYPSNYNLKGKRWSPRVATMTPELLNCKNRWILMSGIPLYLWSSEVFDLICSSFGKVRKVESIYSDANKGTQ